MTEATAKPTPKKHIILCHFCSRRLRVPKHSKELKVKCPSCGQRFNYKNTWFKRLLRLSSPSARYTVAGLIGGAVGFALAELADVFLLFRLPSILTVPLSTGLFGAVLGAFLSAVHSFFVKDWPRFKYGLKTGALLGFVGGAVAGLLGQLVFSLILNIAGETASWPWIIGARVLGWTLLGLALGAAYGIKENTAGDLKSGLWGGALGGALGGLLFDPVANLLPITGGYIGRLLGFTVLGGAIGAAISGVREVALRRESASMYTPLSKRLPNNPRLRLSGK